MRKNFGSKPWAYPQPVFILAAYDENGEFNCMNAAWGGISDVNQIALCISPGHKTTKNLLKTKAFTVSMGTEATVAACDYVGTASGNRVKNKMETAGFSAIKSDYVNAPIINELPMTVECRLISYNPNSCILLGEIVNVSADESVIGPDGNISCELLKPLVLDACTGEYRKTGEAVGKVGQAGKVLIK